MTGDEVLAVVQRATATVLERDPASVTRETRFKDDPRADSLALVELAQIVEVQLAPYAPPGFHLADEDLSSLTTVGDVVDYVLARL